MRNGYINDISTLRIYYPSILICQKVLGQKWLTGWRDKRNDELTKLGVEINTLLYYRNFELLCKYVAELERELARQNTTKDKANEKRIIDSVIRNNRFIEFVARELQHPG